MKVKYSFSYTLIIMNFEIFLSSKFLTIVFPECMDVDATATCDDDNAYKPIVNLVSPASTPDEVETRTSEADMSSTLVKDTGENLQLSMVQ